MSRSRRKERALCSFFLRHCGGLDHAVREVVCWLDGICGGIAAGGLGHANSAFQLA